VYIVDVSGKALGASEVGSVKDIAGLQLYEAPVNSPSIEAEIDAVSPLQIVSP
jgi:hypothetical protein